MMTKQRLMAGLKILEEEGIVESCKPPIAQIKKMELPAIKKAFVKNVNRAIAAGVPDEEFPDVIFQLYLELWLK